MVPSLLICWLITSGLPLLLPPLAAFNLPTITCCVHWYHLSTPPLPQHTELVTCRLVMLELSGVHFRRSAIHHWDVTMESRTLGNVSSVWAWWSQWLSSQAWWYSSCPQMALVLGLWLPHTFACGAISPHLLTHHIWPSTTYGIASLCCIQSTEKHMLFSLVSFIYPTITSTHTADHL